jgi:hypothetical protein
MMIFLATLILILVECSNCQFIPPKKQITVGAVEIKWSDNGDYVSFEMNAKVNDDSNVYAAFGFSNDNQMVYDK